MFKRFDKKQVVFTATVLLAGLAVVWYSTLYAERVAVAELRQTAQDRLLLYESTLHAAIQQYRYLPYILSINPDVQALIQQGGEALPLNEYLEAVNSAAGCAALYIINRNGITVASSNWRTPTSYMGHDYHFRPYFRAAMEGREGIFYGVGLTTKVPGYFQSYPIRRNGEIIGAAVVKVEVSQLQKQWREGGETVFVTDNFGIITLATREDWIYRALAAHDEDTLAQIQSEQQPYWGVRLTMMSSARSKMAGMNVLLVGQESFLMGSRVLEGLAGWEMHFLVPTHKVDEQTRVVAGVGAASVVLLLLLGLLFREKNLRKVSRQKATEAKRIHEINQQLEAEVLQRRRKEQELRETQKELIHAGQMAALGQMAASVAHELNQPLVAIRMFSANCKVMLQRGRYEGVHENLETIHDLTGRLAALASQLKSFARKSPGRKERVDLRQSLRNALALMSPHAQSQGTRLEISEPGQALVVRGDPMHLDQIFVNLLQNSLDAVQDAEHRLVRIELERGQGFAEVTVCDNGPGLSPDAEERLFSPFFTTKEPGQGLGLGLSIIHGIIRNMNGDIAGYNRQEGGACFKVRLPLDNDGQQQ